MQMQVSGSAQDGSIAAAELAVDPLMLAARIALCPLDYIGQGFVLGHYRCVSHNEIPSIGPMATTNICAFRFAGLHSQPNANAEVDPSLTTFAVLLNLRVGISVTSIVTAQAYPSISAYFVRNYTLEDLNGGVADDLTGNNNKMRTSMESAAMSTGAGSRPVSFLHANGLFGLTGGQGTEDANPFGSVIVRGLGNIGTGFPMSEVYSISTHAGHPVVFRTQEGFRLRWGPIALATGFIIPTIQCEWATVVVF